MPYRSSHYLTRLIGVFKAKLQKSMARRLSSSLTRRIVVLNLIGLIALLVGFLSLSQLKEGLVEARVQSLSIQAEIIASAIAASATLETDSVNIDPDRLLQLQAGEVTSSDDDLISPLEFSINPERVTPLLSKLVTPTQTQARIFDPEGNLILDSAKLLSGVPSQNQTVTKATSNAQRAEGFTGILSYLWPETHRTAFENLSGSSLEVKKALLGEKAKAVSLNNNGETIVLVALPIQRLHAVRGALVLSTQGGDIDGMIASERIAILKFFLISAFIMIVLSVFLAGTIAEPVRRLAYGAEMVKRGIKSRHEIPDFTRRSDEIGHLSVALRDMTQALYKRMDAIESFAADVAHELKNPLTSLRSAVETLPVAKNKESQKKLMDIILHDVKRLDRLISDISRASRLDAELARSDIDTVNVSNLLQTVVTVGNSLKKPEDPDVQLNLHDNKELLVLGHKGRLGQVITNLIDNARSFSPSGGVVGVGLSRAGSHARIVVEDQGPGISEDVMDRIFERFYTDRPHHGNNSGLGLSISRHIVEAHGGKIWAENIYGALFIADTSENRNDNQAEQDKILSKGARTKPFHILGARFVVTLPLVSLPLTS